LLQSTANVRVWIFLSDQAAATMYGSATPAGNWIALRFDTGAGDTTWQLIVSKAGSRASVDTTITPDTSEHTYEIYYDNSNSQVLAYIDGVLRASQVTAANLPANTVLTWAGAYITTLASSTKYVDYAYDYIESDF
jgi:hypothetical protein